MAQLFEQISNDITEAMKARDKVRLDTFNRLAKTLPMPNWHK